MQTTDYGTTGLRVSVLGLGASELRDADAATAESVLNAALDLGMTLIDTAHCYGDSEEKIGRHLRHRRDEYVLATKTGHKLDGVADWTPEAVRGGVEQSLRLLRTDHLDIVHLHSCDLDVLQAEVVIETLEDLRDAGAIGHIGYSGDNEPLAWAVRSGRFTSIETSLNLADQWSLHHVLGETTDRGIGVIAKRPIANAPWRHATRPGGTYGEEYWHRMQVLAYEVELDPLEFALRFAAFAPGVSTAITGSTNPDHLTANVAVLARGPLPDDVLAHVARRWAERGQDFTGLR
ncbi:aldo/keto reductase [Propionibacteriaceae bacterium Y2011]|uniref:aldo/keto reductase n=1 Tax=Microlunatus sp. Y2014 TaxID=3418488 RepID=UPI003B44F706